MTSGPSTTPGFCRRAVAEFHQEYPPSRAVFGHLEKIDDTREPGAARELRSNLGQGYLGELRDFDFPRWQLVPATHAHMRTLPQAHGVRDLALADAFAQHVEELHRLEPN